MERGAAPAAVRVFPDAGEGGNLGAGWVSQPCAPGGARRARPPALGPAVAIAHRKVRQVKSVSRRTQSPDM